MWKGFSVLLQHEWSVFPTVVSEEEIVNYVEMTKGGYVSASDMNEIDELFNTWPSYELKATPQTN